MTNLPRTPGPHKIDVAQHINELFEIEKKVMAGTPYLYQFASIEEFQKCLTQDYPCNTYIWNNAQGKTIGFFSHYAREEKTDELVLIVILPEFQNQGFGKKMMQFYFDLIKNQSKSIVVTHEKNSAAIHFYESLGYKQIKKVPNIYNDGQTRILFEKTF